MLGNVAYTYHHHSLTSTTAGNSASSVAGAYTDSYQAATSGGCFTTPVYHVHTTNAAPCYYFYDCPGKMNVCGSMENGRYPTKCSACGATGTDTDTTASDCHKGDKWILDCDLADTIDHYEIGCGHTECELIGATITYRSSIFLRSAGWYINHVLGAWIPWHIEVGTINGKQTVSPIEKAWILHGFVKLMKQMRKHLWCQFILCLLIGGCRHTVFQIRKC